MEELRMLKIAYEEGLMSETTYRERQNRLLDRMFPSTSERPKADGESGKAGIGKASSLGVSANGSAVPSAGSREERTRLSGGEVTGKLPVRLIVKNQKSQGVVSSGELAVSGQKRKERSGPGSSSAAALNSFPTAPTDGRAISQDPQGQAPGERVPEQRRGMQQQLGGRGALLTSGRSTGVSGGLTRSQEMPHNQNGTRSAPGERPLKVMRKNTGDATEAPKLVVRITNQPKNQPRVEKEVLRTSSGTKLTVVKKSGGGHGGSTVSRGATSSGGKVIVVKSSAGGHGGDARRASYSSRGVATRVVYTNQPGNGKGGTTRKKAQKFSVRI
eukprot:CAMPEP_0119130126 /NCGR_PEP_ID=MMETSP1310-20130426/7586_1 /TAXON_ID=464262 /ORGANISM="Genus nov. species nov., Strain RCC2339" /LENGTH=328 /DNA_ID=CAMNT_0007120603 /DNA_START=96 /DNA_END=1082 /DNA_ORIENTATION=-